MILLLASGWVGAAVLAWALIALVRRYALASEILDRPNKRSLHVRPTPRGGGLGMVIPALAAIAVAWALGLLDARTAGGLGGGAAVIAGIGWLDDRRGISATVRLFVHAAAAAALVVALGGFPILDLGPGRLVLGAWGSVLAVIAVVWCTNLYNFMDGIDGIAGLQSVSAGTVGGFLLFAGGASGLALVAFASAGASLGFLLWNWPPARIFMGDVGSGLLGFLYAGLALAGDSIGAMPALVWALLLGVFAFDATTTLIRRLIRGERWYEAHRSHAYQRLVQSGWSHLAVDRAVIGLNLLLALLAVAGWVWRGWLPVALMVGGISLAAAYIFVERRFPSPSNAGHSS